MMPHEFTVSVIAPQGQFALTGHSHRKLRDLLSDAHLRLDSACGGAGSCGRCQLRVAEGRTTPITAAERMSLPEERLAQGWRLGCQVSLLSPAVVVLNDQPELPTWHVIPDSELIADRELAGQAQFRPGLGAAVDIGTTWIRTSLWDLETGRRLGSRSGRNPQAHFGADVLSRLEAARKGHAERLRELVVHAIGEAIHALLADAHVAAGEVDLDHIVVVGNTSMLMLLTETLPDGLLDPNAWELPVSLRTASLASIRPLWHLRDDAKLEVIAPLGGFVGSDLTSCLIALGVGPPDTGSLTVDVGTNTEIAFADGDHLWVTSTPGGPALEGVGIACGMPAEPGAVYSLTATSTPACYSAKVLGDAQPRGLCGSGLVDAIALMLQEGVVQPSGRLAAQHGSSASFMAQPMERTAEPAVMALAGRDIDAFQRAKAAIAAAIETLLKLAGKQWSDIDRLIVCGLFGSHLDLSHAKALGLLPNLPDQRIRLLGNAALTGCEMALLAGNGRERADRLASRARLTNLATLPEFEDCFIGHLRLRPVECRGPKEHGHAG